MDTILTTLQQTHPPILCYEIWEYDNEILGSLIDWKPWFQAIRDYEINFDLRGKEAHFILVSHDGSITRKEAIEFARAIHEKKYRTIHVELEPCSK